MSNMVCLAVAMVLCHSLPHYTHKLHYYNRINVNYMVLHLVMSSDRHDWGDLSQARCLAQLVGPLLMSGGSPGRTCCCVPPYRPVEDVVIPYPGYLPAMRPDYCPGLALHIDPAQVAVLVLIPALVFSSCSWLLHWPGPLSLSCSWSWPSFFS